MRPMSMIPDATTLRALQRLYEAEFRCPTARLEQAAPHVEWSDAREERALRGVAAEDREHLHWLVDLLAERGSGPPPASYATDSAAAHYTRLDVLLPQWIRAERALIAAYQSAAAALAGDRPAAAVASRIVQRHAAHLATLEGLRPAAAGRG
jgi:hypothetical protein